MSMKVVAVEAVMYKTLLMKRYADFVALLISHPAPREAFCPTGYLTSSIGMGPVLQSIRPVQVA